MDPTSRVIAGLARLVTEAPWTLSRADLARAHVAGLSDEAVLIVIALSSAFNHLNRMADAVGIELDYEVVIQPPTAVAGTPPMLRAEPSQWPDPDAVRPLELSWRPALAAVLADARAYVLERDTPLSMPQRQVIVRAVAERLGDAGTVRRLLHIEPRTEVDRTLERFADIATLTPWRLGVETLALLRSAGLDEPAMFDAMGVASFCNLVSRLDVALAALGR